jgi:membrane protein implicated in regulation of membrane protease activity
MDTLIYAICLVIGLLFTLLSAMAGHLFGGDADGHADVGTGGHAEAGFDSSGLPVMSAFSPTSIAAFISAFGALGLIFTKIPATSSPWASAPLSVVGATGIAAGVLWVFNKVFTKTQSSSEAKVASLVGATATVITPITEDGVGEIAYVQAGTRYTSPARSDSGTAIKNGQTVRITRIVGTQFYVRSE